MMLFKNSVTLGLNVSFVFMFNFFQFLSTAVLSVRLHNKIKKLCGRPPQYAPPLQVDLWPFDVESCVRVTCNVAYLCANFSLPRPLCSQLRPDERDRQSCAS